MVVMLVLLSACEAEAPQRPVAKALPKSVCDQAQKAISGVTESGALILTSPVEGMIAHEAWLQMPQGSRDALAQAMGRSATCSEGRPRLEQEVVIRSETGMVLTRRVVNTSLSMDGL